MIAGPAGGQTQNAPGGLHLYIAAILAALVLTLAPARAAGAPCPVEAPCRVAAGDYALRLPASWDRRRPLPVLMFFHGYGDTPAAVLSDRDIAALADTEDVILVVPAGVGRLWHVRPGGARPRDDLAFAEDVLTDVLARLPVDRRLVVAGGFSAGAFMTWNLACYGSARFTGFLPVAGAFWSPVPEGPCPSGPRPIRHVHGLADRMVPLAGRLVSSGARQGDIRASLAAALTTNRCSPVTTGDTAGDLACTQWRGCVAGAPLAFCTHAGGHTLRASWLSDGLGWLRRTVAPRAAP